MTATPTPLRERLLAGVNAAEANRLPAIAALLREAEAALSARDEAGWPFVEEVGPTGKPTGYWLRKRDPEAAVGEVRIQNGCIVSTSIKRPLADGGYDVVPQTATPPASGEAGADADGVGDAAARQAIVFMDRLWGSRMFRACVSSGGEINLIFGATANPFQILIDDSGVSYHGYLADGSEACASSTNAIEFPHYDELRRLAAVAPAGMEDESGWREALQKVADEWGIDFGGAEAFFLDALRLWKPNKTHLLIHWSELIEGDSYGVYGSDFYRCKLCGAESGAGVLNKGIPHDSSCYLATPPASGEAGADTVGELIEAVLAERLTRRCGSGAEHSAATARVTAALLAVADIRRLAAVAPAGMVLVPREPTHAMLCEAAKRVFAEAAEEFQDDGSFAERIVLETQRKCYVAMIAAAPTQPATAGKE